MRKLKIPASEVKGFNYHPSYSTGSLEDWIMFNRDVWEKELTHGKKCFPKFNTLRIWLSWNAYCRMGDRFIECIKEVVEICRGLGIYVMPCLFNRWHDPMIDCDGIYIDHFLPNSSWLLKFGDPFTKYIADLAAAFKDEEQILCWDVCNEPLAYNGEFPMMETVKKYELEWLHRMTDGLRAGGVTQPIGIGTTGMEPMTDFDDMCDVYLTHLYYRNDLVGFERNLLALLEEAKDNGDKEVIISECCWGSLDDKRRAERVRGTLSTITKYGAGFVAHALWTCGCADLHDISEGPVTDGIGNLAFILRDGTVRPYHEIYNEF